MFIIYCTNEKEKQFSERMHLKNNVQQFKGTLLLPRTSGDLVQISTVFVPGRLGTPDSRGGLAVRHGRWEPLRTRGDAT